MARAPQALYQIPAAKPASLRPAAPALRELLACLIAGCQLTLRAYWARLRARRSPWSPTWPARSPVLPRVSPGGRALSREPYLRPTAQCDCHAGEVIALAESLRAGTRSDWDYAQAVFAFASNAIDYAADLPPRQGVVGTLRRGFGTCHEKQHVLVALARAGGIPARYCSIGVAPGEAGVASLTHDDAGVFGVVTQAPKRFLAEDNDPRAKRILALFLERLTRVRAALRTAALSSPDGQPPRQSTHYIVELGIGGIWIPADPTSSDADCAAYNLPLARLGYEPVALGRLMGMVIVDRSEVIPITRRRYLSWIATILLARGLFDHLNQFGHRTRTRGREILEQAGAAALIRKRPHLYRRIPAVTTELGIPLPPYPAS